MDSKTPLKLHPAQNIENVRPGKHFSILHGWYTRGVARDVFPNNSGKEKADLFQDLSGDFLKGVKEASSPAFYPRLTLKLGGLLDSNIDLDHAFTTKWNILKKPLYKPY